jgi:hypothetical protein
MKRLLQTVIAASGLVAASAVQAEVFTATISSQPERSGTDCDQHSYDLGQKFAAQYGVRVVEAYCQFSESGSRKGWTTQIRYEAEQALQRISTADTASGAIVGGTYAKPEDCEAELSEEHSRFAEKTGLTPFVSYCARSEFDRRPVTLTVLAFAAGEVAVRPYITGTYYFGKVFGMTAAEFTEMLRSGFAANGADLVQWMTEPSLGYGVLKIRYYGPSLLQFSEIEYAKMRNEDECLSQVAEFASGIRAWSGASLGSFCHQMSGVGSGIELVSLVLRDQEPRMIRPSGQYADFSSCMAAKPAVIERYRTEQQRLILAGLCGLDQDRRSYVMTLIERPRT